MVNMETINNKPKHTTFLIFVICFQFSFWITPGDCTIEGDLRLVGGFSYKMGRVEIYHDGMWGTICDGNWNDNDAKVVCKQLGISTIGTAYRLSTFGPGRGIIWLDSVQCTGAETSLVNCAHSVWGINNCLHSDDNSVVCGDIRLVNGPSHNIGRVEVFRYNYNAWGTVCHDLWENNDATVACRQLGIEAAGIAFYSAHFGSGTGYTWLDDVQCVGNEDSLVECNNRGWGVEDCHHGEDAGVSCNGIRLVGGSSDYEGRVEIVYFDSWGTVCDTNWDNVDASVACRGLMLSDTGTAFSHAVFGQGSGEIILNGVQCIGIEGSLLECQTQAGENTCTHANDAGLICHDVRLAGGFNSMMGRVEIYHDGVWTSVCDDGWDDTDASIVCRQLGFGDAGVSTCCAEFGRGDSQTWLSNVRCTGTEYTLRDCSNSGWGIINCSHSEDAGVYCGGSSSCTSNPCYNGGTCILQQHGYTCICTVGYKGIQCDELANQTEKAQGASSQTSIFAFLGILLVIVVALIIVVIFLCIRLRDIIYPIEC